MNDNARKWADVLPTYPQTRHLLRTDEGFCCMGVACDVFHKDTGRGAWVVSSDGTFYFELDDERQKAVPPADVLKWLGLKDALGTHTGPSCVSGTGRIKFNRSLVGMNDTQESFTAIAEMIKSEPEGLFVDE